jgi:drug/metabolite transporter (DMT)-like permease
MKAWVKLSLTAFFWAGAFFAGKAAVTIAPPVMAAFLRFFMAGILFLILAHNQGAFREVKGTLWLNILVLAFVGIFLYNLFFFYGISLTSTTNGSLIAGANPAVTALLSFVFRGERLAGRRWLGIFISFLGVVLVISQGSLEVLLHMKMNPGDLLIVCAATCWAIYSILGRDVMRRISPLAASAFACYLGSIMLFPAALATTDQVSWRSDWMFWLEVAYMAIFASVLAYKWWYEGVLEIGASRSAVYVNLVPVFVMLLNVFMGHFPSEAQLGGAALVLVGVYLTSGNIQRAGKERMASSTESNTASN